MSLDFISYSAVYFIFKLANILDFVCAFSQLFGLKNSKTTDQWLTIYPATRVINCGICHPYFSRLLLYLLHFYLFLLSFLLLTTPPLPPFPSESFENSYRDHLNTFQIQVGYTFEIETQISVMVFVWEIFLDRNECTLGLLYPQTQPHLTPLVME